MVGVEGYSDNWRTYCGLMSWTWGGGVGFNVYRELRLLTISATRRLLEYYFMIHSTDGSAILFLSSSRYLNLIPCRMRLGDEP
jgi:hypothetical protein